MKSPAPRLDRRTLAASARNKLADQKRLNARRSKLLSDRRASPDTARA
ncbi:hypothetical protein [Microvirga tunisiensis]|nr:hypothetical protein [Microvirga tunisiensis]